MAPARYGFGVVIEPALQEIFGVAVIVMTNKRKRPADEGTKPAWNRLGMSENDYEDKKVRAPSSKQLVFIPVDEAKKREKPSIKESLSPLKQVLALKNVTTSLDKIRSLRPAMIADDIDRQLLKLENLTSIEKKFINRTEVNNASSRLRNEIRAMGSITLLKEALHDLHKTLESYLNVIDKANKSL
jgi:hypothetical protein